MIKLNKIQADKVGTIVVETDKQGRPVLVITPVQISDDEFIIDDVHESILLDKTKLKSSELIKKEYTKSEIELKQKALIEGNILPNITK